MSIAPPNSPSGNGRSRASATRKSTSRPALAARDFAAAIAPSATSIPETANPERARNNELVPAPQPTSRRRVPAFHHPAFAPSSTHGYGRGENQGRSRYGVLAYVALHSAR